MLRLMLIISLVLNFTSAYAHDPSVCRLRFQNNGSATATGLLAALFTLHLNPVFARGVWNGLATGWGAAILHFGLIGYGGYEFGQWKSSQRKLTVRASRREQLAGAFDQLIAEVHAQIPPGSSRFVDIPEWLAQQSDLNHEPQIQKRPG